MDEGFVHERRVQGPGGHWMTQQLVSSTPLTSDEAIKLLSRTPVPTCTNPASPQVAPSPRKPAAGRPTTPPTQPPPAPPAPTNRLSVRLQGTRECTSGTHTQPMLFRPTADETLCGECVPARP
jgi:hypothetical protein